LDIGTTAIRAAELSFGSGGPGKSEATMTAFAQVPLAPGAIQDGEVLDMGKVSVAIKMLWQMGKFSSSDVVMGVGNQRVIVREVDLPWQPVEALKRSLPYQAEQLLPVAVETLSSTSSPPVSFRMKMDGSFPVCSLLRFTTWCQQT
jgi:type IV pilus assembly protein PilM